MKNHINEYFHTSPLPLLPVWRHHISHTTLFMGKDKDDQTGVNNKVPEHKVTRRSRTSTNQEALYRDAEGEARSQSGKETEKKRKMMMPSKM